jgi:hypothetical protein
MGSSSLWHGHCRTRSSGRPWQAAEKERRAAQPGETDAARHQTALHLSGRAHEAGQNVRLTEASHLLSPVSLQRTDAPPAVSQIVYSAESAFVVM